MNEDRINKISELNEQLESETRSGQTALWEKFLERFTIIREQPAQIRRWWDDISSPLRNVVTKWSGGIMKVLGYNESYFEPYEPSEELIKSVRDEILDRMGMNDKGQILSGGYWDNVAKDARIPQQVSQQVWRSKLLPDDKARAILKEMFIGSPDSPGILERNWSEYTYDVLQQTDRSTQSAYAAGLGLTAQLFSGGIIANSREFCRARDGKVFLDAEIALFGTPRDRYPGYVNRSTGYFAGKPMVGYDPFTQLGGYRCRHFRSYISNQEALRRRADLKEVNGKLVIDQPVNPPVPEPEPEPVKVPKPKKPPVDPAVKDLKTKTSYLKKLKSFKEYISITLAKGMDKVFPDLTDIQRGTVFGYTTTEFHYDLNSYLVARDLGKDVTRFESMKRRLESIETVLKDALESIQPPFKGEVYRGVQLSPEQISRYQKALDTGKAVTEPYFISTTTDIDKPFAGNVQFVIQSKSGRSIQKLSDVPREDEVLIPAGKQFKVTGIEPLGSSVYISMEEL